MKDDVYSRRLKRSKISKMEPKKIKFDSIVEDTLEAKDSSGTNMEDDVKPKILKFDDPSGLQQIFLPCFFN